MKKLIKILIMLFVVPTTINAQLQIGREPDVPSAQTWDFIKYGNANANLHTGMVNVSIPFYTYKDKDFEIPVSFDYASDGFKPNSLSGILGHDWVLNVGGCITREMRGMPDDVNEHIRIPAFLHEDNIWYSDNICKGFHYLHGSGISESSMDLNFALDYKDDAVSYYSMGNSPVYYDVEPDIFHFNFMGYSGSFYFWYNGKTKVYHANTYNGEFKIKLTINEYYKYSSFEITTGDGYKYVFGNSDYTGGEYAGGAPSTGLDFIKKQDPLYPSEDPGYPIIKTWKLIKITAPNGRNAEFNYVTTGATDKNGNRAADIKEYNPVSTTHKYVLYGTNPNEQTCSFPEYPRNPTKIDSCRLYTDYLSSISIDGFPYINFFYKEIKGERVKYVANNSWETKTKQIDSLYLKLDSIGTPWKSCSFRYKYPTFNNTGYPINKIPFLDSINISDEGAYAFEYYNREDRLFPYIGTFSLDHWGYYNGNNKLI
ncbi:MAG: hypothetical protein LBK94_12145 [Prevotellaceae bacterium]|jgi:hypothetical protein|nr:hypothetical protein [Prevotellaceae bacterium]